MSSKPTPERRSAPEAPRVLGRTPVRALEGIVDDAVSAIKDMQAADAEIAAIQKKLEPHARYLPQIPEGATHADIRAAYIDARRAAPKEVRPLMAKMVAGLEKLQLAADRVTTLHGELQAARPQSMSEAAYRVMVREKVQAHPEGKKLMELFEQDNPVAASAGTLADQHRHRGGRDLNGKKSHGEGEPKKAGKNGKFFKKVGKFFNKHGEAVVIAGVVTAAIVGVIAWAGGQREQEMDRRDNNSQRAL